jgi:hypothetical protein
MDHIAVEAFYRVLVQVLESLCLRLNYQLIPLRDALLCQRDDQLLGSNHDGRSGAWSQLSRLLWSLDCLHYQGEELGDCLAYC